MGYKEGNIIKLFKRLFMNIIYKVYIYLFFYFCSLFYINIVFKMFWKVGILKYYKYFICFYNVLVIFVVVLLYVLNY